MTKSNCDLYFPVLAKIWNEPARVILVGGAAAQVMGGSRPTGDIDFELSISGGFSKWEKFYEVSEKAERITGLKAHYFEKIEKYLRIDLLDYRKHRRHYISFGKIEVDLLEPAYWSIGKIARYLDNDVQDLIAVFKNDKMDPVALARLWKKAIDRSVRSSEIQLIRKHPPHFFKTYGREIWGKKFPEEEIKKIFYLSS